MEHVLHHGIDREALASGVDADELAGVAARDRHLIRRAPLVVSTVRTTDDLVKDEVVVDVASAELRADGSLKLAALFMALRLRLIASRLSPRAP